MTSIDVRSFAESTQVLGEPLLAPDTLARADADMRHLLTTLIDLGFRSPEEIGVEAARRQPTLATALSRVMRGRVDDSGMTMEFRMIPGPAGDIRTRIYLPITPFVPGSAPIILYLHGGGFVAGDLEAYDPAARALCRKTGAIILAPHYRQAPEHKFPSAHEDALAAWNWLVEHAASLGGAPERMAVAGEGSGGNLAVYLSLQARDAKRARPLHQLLISPMTGPNFPLPSYDQNDTSVPLNGRAVRWFYEQIGDDAALADPRISLGSRGDLAGLPPTTILLAEIDPLRSEGEALASALRRAGVSVDCTVYEGVTHDFFGLGGVVNKAMFAQSQAGRNLSEAFAQPA